MVLREYENELCPDEAMSHDFNWYLWYLLHLPTENLIQVYREKVNYLEELRCKEPPKKRRKLGHYRGWVKYSHDVRDELNLISEELRRRGLK